MNKNIPEIDRRSFMKTAAGATAASLMAFPNIMTGQSGGMAPSEKLDLAFVGVGGKGRTSIIPISKLGHNIIGLTQNFSRESVVR